MSTAAAAMSSSKNIRSAPTRVSRLSPPPGDCTPDQASREELNQPLKPVPSAAISSSRSRMACKVPVSVATALPQ